MAIPTTYPLTLQDVIDEVNPTTNDLVDCFSDATGTFNPTYAIAGQDALSEFRGYTVITPPSIINVQGFSNMAGGTSFSGTLPTRQVDDLLVYAVAYDKFASILGGPSSTYWDTLTEQELGLTNGPSLAIYLCRVTAANINSISTSVTFDQSTPYMWSMISVRGTPTPAVGSNWQGFVSIGTVTSITDSISGDQNNSLFMYVLGTDNPGSTPTGTDWTALNTFSGTSTLSGRIYYEVYPDINSVNPEINLTLSSTYYRGIMFEIYGQ